MTDCKKCGFWDSDYEACSCPLIDKWYACPIENEMPENKQNIEEWLTWLGERMSGEKNDDDAR